MFAVTCLPGFASGNYHHPLAVGQDKVLLRYDTPYYLIIMLDLATVKPLWSLNVTARVEGLPGSAVSVLNPEDIRNPGLASRIDHTFAWASPDGTFLLFMDNKVRRMVP